jgi:hypothetical protein
MGARLAGGKTTGYPNLAQLALVGAALAAMLFAKGIAAEAAPTKA